MISSTFFCWGFFCWGLFSVRFNYSSWKLYQGNFIRDKWRPPPPSKSSFWLNLKNLPCKLYSCMCFPSRCEDFWARQCFGRIRETSLTHSITLVFDNDHLTGGNPSQRLVSTGMWWYVLPLAGSHVFQLDMQFLMLNYVYCSLSKGAST